MRSLLPTLVMCAIALPVHAKYSGGRGVPDDPYQIAKAEDLIALGNEPNDYDKHFILIDDIDLDPNLPGGKVFDKAVIAPDANDANWWFDGTPFTGVFDGNDHTISHLTVHGKDFLGLFGSLQSGAVVRNIGVVDVNIFGSGVNVGGLVGENDGYVTVSRCYSKGTIHSKGAFIPALPGFESVGGLGGLVGNNKDGIVTQCYSVVAVDGNEAVGGLIGCNARYGTLTECYSTGAVSGTKGVGGLVGYTLGGNIMNSYSLASTSGGNGVGGLVGIAEASEECSDYCYGVVPGSCCYYICPTIIGSYAVGSVIGGDDTGGLVGNSDCNPLGNGWDLTPCFWDIKTTGILVGVGNIDPDPNGVMGKTTAQMKTKSTFTSAGWDFVGETANGTEDIWWIDEGKDYPRLWWEKGDEASL